MPDYMHKCAERLNTLTSQLNYRISAEEAYLKEIGLGVEAWSGNFGYAKVSGAWRLCYRNEEGVVQTLQDTPRQVRVEALLCLFDLKSTLLNTAWQLTKDIEAALEQCSEVPK